MKPNYYQKGGMECFDAIKAATEGLTGYEGFLTGNIVKYAWRWNDKGGVADLEKAAEYVRRLIKTREPRPYTPDELKALPDGARVWARNGPQGIYKSMWHTKRGDKLLDENGQYYHIDDRGWHDHCFRPQFWPTEPTPEESAAWPWGGGGK